MCNSRPTQRKPQTQLAPSKDLKDEGEKRDPSTLNIQKKASLAKLFMHNPQFAETFFKARIGEEGMIRFKALQSHISKMPNEGLECILEQRVVGTLTLLSKFFEPADQNPTWQGKDEVVEKDNGEEDDRVERVKMNKWCWIFLGAWTVGEAGRVLESRKEVSTHRPTV